MKTPPLLTKIGSTVSEALSQLTATSKLAADAARTAVADLQGAVRAITEQRVVATAEREALLSARPPMAEVLAALDQDLARVGRHWREVYGPNLLSVLAPVVDPTSAPTYRAIRHGALEQVFPASFDLGTLAALFPAMIREGLVAALPAFASGPPMTERPALLAAVDAQVLELETQHAQLVDQAAAAGIVLDHLPETIARRHREARDQERIDAYNRANAALIHAGRIRAATTIEEAR